MPSQEEILKRFQRRFERAAAHAAALKTDEERALELIGADLGSPVSLTVQHNYRGVNWITCGKHQFAHSDKDGCPLCQEEPRPLAPADIEGLERAWAAAKGPGLLPYDSGHAEELRRLCDAKDAQIASMRASLDKAIAEVAEARRERDAYKAGHRYVIDQLTYADLEIVALKRRLSAAWEHLPCVTTGAKAPPNSTHPLRRAIGAPQRMAVGLMTERG